MKKKGILLVIATFIFAGSVVTYGSMHYNNEVQAEQLAIKKRQTEKKKNEAVENAQKAVDLAYKTRKENHVAAAERAIIRIDSKDGKTKDKLIEKMTALKELLKQIEAVDNAIAKAEKTEKDADIKTAQKVIGKMTDAYLKADKKVAQDRLDKLKDKIKKDKAKKEAQAEEKARRKAEEEAQQITEATEDSSQGEPSYEEQYEEPNYQPDYQEPSYPSYTPPAPPQNDQQGQDQESSTESTPETMPNESEQDDGGNASGGVGEETEGSNGAEVETGDIAAQ